MINDETYIPIHGTLTAVCRNTHDCWNNINLPQLTIGETYEVEYAIIGRSWTRVCLKEFPNELYNSSLFNFYINGEDIHIVTDYRALKRMTNGNYYETTTLIYSSLSGTRIAEIKEMHNNTRILIRSELLK